MVNPSQHFNVVSTLCFNVVDLKENETDKTQLGNTTDNNNLKERILIL